MKGQRSLSLRQRVSRELWRNRYIYIMAIPVIVYYLLFCYGPMYGAQIAFRNFSIVRGITESPWVGLKWFDAFIKGPYFSRIVSNTIIISLYSIVFGFPAPIILAILLNELRSNTLKRAVQSIVYLPHFISLVVVCGLIRTFVARYGIITNFLTLFGFERTNLLGSPQYFRPIFIFSGIWQEVGWGSIIYLSALTSISPELYESATIDGANRFQRIIHITLPGIRPTIITLFVLRIGQIMSVGSEKVLLLYNPNTYEVADVISTFVYRVGIAESFQPSFSTAIGLFSAIINFVLLFSANTICKKTSGSSLW